MKSKVELLQMECMGYRHSAAILTAIFFLTGIVFSLLGFTSPHMDFSFFGGKGFTGTLLALGVVIAINERIMELVTNTYRRNTRANIELEMQKSSSADRENWDKLYLAYKSETGRLVLTLSLCFGCLLASVGFFRLLEGLSVDELISGKQHHAFFDALDIVASGWIVAGGSAGYYKLLEAISGVFKFKSDLDKTSVGK